MHYIADGEIHVLNEEIAYILKYIEEDNIRNTLVLEDKMREFLKKYSNYLIEFQREKVIEMLVEKLMPSLLGNNPSDEYQFIYRPPWLDSCLRDKSMLFLKFKRSKNDNLKYEIKNDR